MPQASLPTQYNSYDLTVGVIVDMEDMIHMLDPIEVPLLGMNGADGRSTIARGTCFEKKVEWLDEELLMPNSTAAATATAGQTTISVASGHGSRFSTGDVIAIGAERLNVTGISTDTLTVTRAFASTTAATIATSATILILGQALLEGSNPENPRAKDRVNRSNITQIWGPTSVRVSGTENVVRKYGLSGTTEFDKQVANRTKEMYIQIEQAILYGRFTEGSEGASTELRTMGGFDHYISTNTDSTTTVITESALLAQMQASWATGGNVDRVAMGATQKRKFSALATGLTLQAMRTDDTRGTVVNYFDCDFGRVTLILHRWMRTSDIFGWNRNQAEFLTLRPLQFEMLAKTGDSIHGQIVCEHTMRFRRERHAFKFTALT